MKTSWALFLALTAVVLSQNSFADFDSKPISLNPAPPLPQDQALDRVLARYMKKHSLSGVLKVVTPQFTFLRQLGVANDETAVTNTEDTPFIIASVSKQWVASGILKLEQDKKLDSNDFISRFFPEYPVQYLTGKNGEQVRIVDLLHHTSGLFEAYDDDKLDNRVLKEPLTIRDILAVLTTHQLSKDPGDEFHYSDSGYDLLAAIISRVSHLSYSHFMDQTFFFPLHLTHTHAGYSSTLEPIMARSYKSARRGKPRVDVLKKAGQSLIYNTEDLAAGNIVSSARDMTTWLRSLSHSQILSAESLKRLWTPSDVEPYACGWNVEDQGEESPVYWHVGGWVGYNSLAAVSPSDDTSFVWLGNEEMPEGMQDHFFDDLLRAVWPGRHFFHDAK